MRKGVLELCILFREEEENNLPQMKKLFFYTFG